jgi:glycosyltransferase involved in cell wall biosynthesis
MKKVLIFTWFYEPANKGGGPIRSIRNLVDVLSDKIEFYIITSDRDLGDKSNYVGVKIESWVRVGNAQVYYVDKSKLTWLRLCAIINEIGFDFIYLNSFFSYKFSILPLILWNLKLINCKRLILAPRGEFTKGALCQKRYKKYFYVNFSRFFGWYKSVQWHASSNFEKQDITNLFRSKDLIYVAKNLVSIDDNVKSKRKPYKAKGSLKLVYLSRVHPMKNLLTTLLLLQKVEGNIEFNICGSIEDVEYWDKCVEVIKGLKSSITVNYQGHITHNSVSNVLTENHVFILLTLGENFGHSIVEAMIHGCPVIISDNTPWKNLSFYGSGYDLSLSNENQIVEAINYYVQLDNNEYERISKLAYDFAIENINLKKDIDSYYEMFEA